MLEATNGYFPIIRLCLAETHSYAGHLSFIESTNNSFLYSQAFNMILNKIDHASLTNSAKFMAPRTMIEN